MAMIRGQLDLEVPDDGFRGRFLAQYSVLEMKGRLFVARELGGRDRYGESTVEVIHDALLARASVGALSEVLRSIIRNRSTENAESWRWLPRDMKAVSGIRNSMVHMPGPWTARESVDRRAALFLSGKVEAGLLQFFPASIDTKEAPLGDEARAAQSGERWVAAYGPAWGIS